VSADQSNQDLIRANYCKVIEQIEKAARSAGRDPASVRLVVVTKGHPLEAVRLAVMAGVRVFGENYVEEGQGKRQALASEANLEWHMIGHVQSRKARLVCESFDWLHSLDSLKLAQRLDRFAGEQQRRLPVLLECNVSGEETKFGWPAWQEAQWSMLAEEISGLVDLPNLDVRGLMTMAPFFTEAEPARPFFKRLRSLRDYLARRLPQLGWEELSMGMSGDYTVAVQEGATIVRIGTAIMGARPLNVN
jgi:hypothetical protein